MSDESQPIGGRARLELGDAIAGMRALPDSSFDLAIADPPYGASSRARWQLERDHALPVFGGSWRLAAHTWDLLGGVEGFELTIAWLSELKRLVRPTGSLWIHATYHNSGIVNVACQILGLEIINEVVWFKRNAFPNLSARRLTASHETILWAHTGGERRDYYFNYEQVKASAFPEDALKVPGKQLRTVWDIPNNKTRAERAFGTHPTQKPLRLTRRMLLISARPGDRLLVPFAGSGTELVAGVMHGMDCVGFELDPEYAAAARRRIRAVLKYP
ncbi:MAG TPA: site-specific DNA-methyltransferase [Herpetosiphonaceae bacterium]